VTLPETPPEGEIAPVTVELEEAPFRSVAAGLRYDTSDGPAVRLRFEHRNVFGENETFRSTLDAGLQNQRLLLDFRKPQYLRPGQDFVSAFEARHIEDDAYDEIGGTLTAGLQRELNERWTVGAGGLIEISEITDNRVTSNAYLFGIPAFAAYDGSNDLLNPTTGERFRLDVTPFTGVYLEENTNFLNLDATASIYRPLDSDARYVVAARTRLGSIISDDVDGIPPTRRLYSGGAGSVRGYQQDFVGPLDDQNDPIGGRSVVEFGAEIRARVWGDIGVVVFADAGSVSQEMFPDFEDGLQYGVGAGVRYYTPVGPIRFDVAVPLDRRDADDPFQFYISIGQAF
jgi:translocation and assembly module TamA